MKRHVGTFAALVAVLALAPVPGFAADGGSAQLAHMSQGQSGHRDCPGMTSRAKMGHGMMGHGMRSMMQQMHRGTKGGGMMGQGMMGQGMMGQGMMGQGMMGPGHGSRVVPQRDLSSDDVRHFLEHRLAMQGNPRLKVGEINEKDDDTVVADIVTTDGALVDRFEVDRHTRQMKRVN